MESRVSRYSLTNLLLYPAAIAAGLAIGALYNQVSRHLEVSIALPILAGVLAGAVIALLGYLMPRTAVRVTLSAAVLAGALAYASSFYFDYLEYRADLAHIGGSTLTAAQVDALEAKLLGSPGLFSYLSARAHYGVAPSGRAGADLAISGDAEWLVWAAEIALAGAAAGLVGRRLIRKGPIDVQAA